MQAMRSLVLVVAALATACTGFREVRPGVFRSPQPGEDQLARRIAEHDIQCIVCLRGLAPSSAGSQRAAEGAGIAFWNVPMSATRRPSPETLLELWRVAERAPRPMLLHCRAGADRTGLATAIVVLHDTGDLDQARAELTIEHGHLGMFGTEAMGEVLDAYEPYAGRMTFPQWVAEVWSAQFAPVPR